MIMGTRYAVFPSQVQAMENHLQTPWLAMEIINQLMETGSLGMGTVDRDIDSLA